MNFLKNLPAKIKFEYLKNKYYAALKPELPKTTEIRNIINELEINGLVIIPNWAGKLETEKIRNEVEPLLKRIQQNVNLDRIKHWRFTEYGVYRLLESDLHSPTANRVFFKSKFVNDIAKAYLSGSAKPYQMMAEIKPDHTKRSIADNVHFDDWKIRFKAFLYLTDVDESGAPFCYYIGTHKNKEIRKRKEFEYFRDGKKGTYGYYTQKEINDLNNKSELKITQCLGKAGTLILVDTRGLHSGTPLINPETPRILLASYFDI